MAMSLLFLFLTVLITNTLSKPCNLNLNCSTTPPTLHIHNLTFTLLHSSSSLLISPKPSPKSQCSSLSAFHFSHSPFHVSSSTCHNLSLLKPCPSVPLPNCTLCPFDCHLVNSPLRLLPDCPVLPRSESEHGCHVNILALLESFPIELEWDGQNCTESEFMCSVEGRVKEEEPNWTGVQGVVILFVCLMVVMLVAVLVLRSRRRMRNKLGLEVGGEDRTVVVYLHRHRSASLLPPAFTYEELEMATNRFDLKRKIGDGGFGCVYVGQLYDGRIVAVKHLHRNCLGGKAFLTKSFCNEILILSSINHPNLVKLHGYCSDTRGLILVYDYVSNGTLFEHLHRRRAMMTWQVRVEIALQIAFAIEYLHFSVLPPIVHRDITSSNIFVEKDMRIKVGDFGLSRLLAFSEKSTNLGSEGCVWTGPQGTPGYLDPDYHHTFRLTEKSDVYSFGVVLLELVTGLKAVDQTREKREVALADLAVGRIQMGLLSQLVDPSLIAEGGTGEVVEGVGAAAELAFRCVANDKDDRPDAREVVAELRRIRSRIRGCAIGVSRVSLNSMNVVVPDNGV